MSVEDAALDTNVLVYALYAAAEHHQAARHLLNRAQSGDVRFYLTPQIFTEFYAVVTNSRRVTQAQSPGDALDAIDAILSLPGITLLPLPNNIVTQWTHLLHQHPVTGSDVFDVLLAATLLGHGITWLYTLNQSDFEQFDDLHVLTPAVS